MLPKFKGITYEEALKRVDMHAMVRVDLPFGHELTRTGTTGLSKT